MVLITSLGNKGANMKNSISHTVNMDSMLCTMLAIVHVFGFLWGFLFFFFFGLFIVLKPELRGQPGFRNC